ncbi:MAG: hypothetical protein ACE5DI_04995 [Candidatus Micrarchaeia archaeon]
MKVLVFGKHALQGDDLAIKTARKLSGKLKKINFVECQDPLAILEEKQNVTILDVAKGISKVQYIKSENLNISKKVSLHDFDLAIAIKLANKMQPSKKMKILAIPLNYTEKKAVNETKKILEKKVLRQ